MVLENKEEVFHKAEAVDLNGKRLDKFAPSAEASQYNKLQRGHLLTWKGKNVHRAWILY